MKLVEYTPVKGPHGWRANVRAVPDPPGERTG
jgi:hypothetical protein